MSVLRCVWPVQVPSNEAILVAFLVFISRLQVFDVLVLDTSHSRMFDPRLFMTFLTLSDPPVSATPVGMSKSEQSSEFNS